jgi:hypothetical protein
MSMDDGVSMPAADRAPLGVCRELPLERLGDIMLSRPTGFGRTFVRKRDRVEWEDNSMSRSLPNMWCDTLLVIHGCSSTWSSVSRCAGSTTSSLDTKSLASGETVLQYLVW